MFFILSQAWDEEKIPHEELLKKFPMNNFITIPHQELL